jgi:hypothetical protein
MAQMPAFCDACGAVFPSGFELRGTVSLAGNRSGPCPGCGSMGHVPDGVFRITGRLIEILSAPTTSVSELMRFSDILTRAQQQGTAPDDLAAQITREAPSFGPLFELLPRTRSELYAFVSLILAAVALVLSAGRKQAPTWQITVQQIIEQTYTQSAMPLHGPAAGSQVRVPVGSRDPCPCGSGKKYEECHGAPR